MKMIVGLGNPGSKYNETRHNIGFMCLDFIAMSNGFKFKVEKKFKAECAIDETEGRTVKRKRT